MKRQSQNQNQNLCVLVLLLLAGVVLGGFLGELLNRFPALKWLAYGKTFGTAAPIALDLGILTLQLGFQIQFTIAGIFGMVLAFLIYRKL